VVRLSAIGDVLHALPAVAGLRLARPDAVIDWLVEDRAAALLEGHPAIDRVVVFPRRRWRTAAARPHRWPALLAEVGRFVGRLVARRYDAVVDLQGNLKSGVLAALAGAPVRVGLPVSASREGNALFTNVKARAGHASPARPERNAAVLSSGLCEVVRAVASDLPRPDGVGARVDAALSAAGLPPRGFALLHPGSSGFGAFKRWPPARFARLADRLHAEAGLRVGLVVGPGEERLAEEVRAAADVRPAMLSTPDLPALAEAIRRAVVFVAADTGPLHVAAAVGTPLLGLYGPKDAAVYGPWGAPAGSDVAGPLATLVREAVPCRPCAIRWCPDPVCMNGIEADAVFDRVRALLAG
jgi:heptosyltransferase I